MESAAILRPNSSRSRDFDELLDPLQGDEISPAEKRLPAETIRNLSTTGDLLSRMGLLGAGKESGRWGGGRLSLRGHPGDEPVVSLGGVLLSSGFSGAHAEDLVPPIAIERLRAYPFFPALNLPQMSVSGGYDIELVRERQDAGRETFLKLELPAAYHLANRTEKSCSEAECLQISWAGSFFRGTSEVLDDRNTPQDPRDDTTQTINDRDLSRLSAVAQYFSESGNGTRWDSTFLLGAESRSTSGLPLSSASEFNRLKRRLVFVSQKYSHFSPSDGLKATVRFAGRQESAHHEQDLMNNSGQIRADQRDEKFISAQGNLMIPLGSGGHDERVLLHTSLEANSFGSEVNVARKLLDHANTNDDNFRSTVTNGHLYSLTAGAGFGMALGGTDSLKSLLNLYSNRFSVERVCGVFSPQVLCSESKNEASGNSVGGNLEWKRTIGRDALIYALAGQLHRLPRPLEVAGRSDGVVANPELKSESTLATELGLESRWGRLSFFFARDQNLISAQQVSPFLLRYDNTASVQRAGVGVDSRVQVFGFDVSADAEWLQVRILKGQSGQRVLPFVAASRWSTAVERNFVLLPSIGAWSGRFLSEIRYDESGSYWLDFQGVSRLKPPGLVALAIGSPFRVANSQLETRFAVRNLFDEPASRLGLAGQPERRVPWSLSPVLPIERRTFEVGFRLLDP
ncbi:MAG: TonB-dependent receptor domain-containing protein [Silvanigrellaceae bacterium]